MIEVRNPNIVQFLGVCFQESKQAPILVMEFLPRNLTSYVLPLKATNCFILHDVALGLFYLHGQTVNNDMSNNTHSRKA